MFYFGLKKNMNNSVLTCVTAIITTILDINEYIFHC